MDRASSYPSFQYISLANALPEPFSSTCMHVQRTTLSLAWLLLGDAFLCFLLLADWSETRRALLLSSTKQVVTRCVDYPSCPQHKLQHCMHAKLRSLQPTGPVDAAFVLLLVRSNRQRSAHLKGKHERRLQAWAPTCMHDQIERKRQTREAHRVTQNGGWALSPSFVDTSFRLTFGQTCAVQVCM